MTGNQPTVKDHRRDVLLAQRESVMRLVAGARAAHQASMTRAGLEWIHHTYRDAYRELADGYQNDVDRWAKRLDAVNAELAALDV